MKFSHTFIDRPILASVLSILIVIIGAISYFSLPITQYPNIAPPSVQVTASFPGANAETVAKSVATPIEQEINGVEGMMYMSSLCTDDGRLTLTVTFDQGVDLDDAQVLVQNRVAIAEPRLPEQVRRIGVTTEKNSPDIMMVVNLYSPDNSLDQIYLANYAVFQVRDLLRRIDGVARVNLIGADEYSMRIWLNPDRIAALKLTTDEILVALRGQNIQVASGALNQNPVNDQLPFEINISTLGRLDSKELFEEVIIKSDAGKIVRLKDVGRVEIGARSYRTKGYLQRYQAVTLPIFQRPGSNAVETANQVKKTMEELAASFPEGLEYGIAWNPTEFVEDSISELSRTIFEAIALVVLVILLFLQNWRASLIPIIAIPVSLIGTFAVMSAFGFSLNNLTLFGLVLAIGIVVDDAIVVVENMERYLEEGLSPKEAARKTMDEVGNALVAIGLVLIAVFLPTTFLEGISGEFFKQFGLTIAVATSISVFVSLTLSPALSAILLKAKKSDDKPSKNILIKFGNGFNTFLDRMTGKYSNGVTRLIRRGSMTMIIYIILIGLTVYQFNAVPSGFVPEQDQGYAIVAIQLPPGSSLSRTDEVMKQVNNILLETEGVKTSVGFAGLDGPTFTNASNSGVIFPIFTDFHDRAEKGLNLTNLVGKIQSAMFQVDEAFIVVIPPPTIRGMGNAGGFNIMLEDRSGRGRATLEKSMQELVASANQQPALRNVFTFYNPNTPKLFLDIDRVKAEKLGIPIQSVFNTLEVYLGSSFVNEFNYLGRTFQVIAQADAPFRYTQDDASRLRVRNDEFKMAPIGSFATFKNESGPALVQRYNLFPAISVLGSVAPGYSTGQALATMEELADQILPEGVGFEWTELAFQEKEAGNTAIIAFVMAVVFVFLLLAAQFESWILPLAVVLIVPMCLLCALTGVSLAGFDNNVMTQIGLVVLVGLASKNAILIVEFAKQLEDQGRPLREAAIEAARLRLRPILMTSLAFSLGVVPLVLASGAGAEMRNVMGVAVFAGMIGVTFFGIFLTPVFYVICRKIGTSKSKVTSANLSTSKTV